MVGDNGENLGFLLGLPRSGTTLLSVMLAGHPDILCPPEPWVALAAEALGHVHAEHPADAGILGEAFDSFIGANRDDAARAYLRAVYEARLAGSGKRFFLDKTPRYYHILDFLDRLFPDARRVVLLRNPLDVAASYRESWGIDIAALLRNAPGERACLDYVLGWQRLTALAASGAVTTVRYEDLVRAPAEALEQALRALDLPFVAGLESFDTADSAFATSPLGDRKVLETHAPHTASLGRWRTVLADDDLSLLLDAAGASTMRAAGYVEVVDELAARGVVGGGEEATADLRQRVAEELASRTAVLAAAARTAPGLPPGRSVVDELAARADAAAARDREARAALALAREEIATLHEAQETALREAEQLAADRDCQCALVAALSAERDLLASENTRVHGELASVLRSRVWRGLEASSRVSRRLRRSRWLPAFAARALEQVEAWLRR